MPTELIYTIPSIESLNMIRKYITKDSIKRGDEFIVEIIQKIENLEKFPYLGLKIGDNKYKYIINKNYKVLYKVTNSKIYVISIKHVKNIEK